jgi:hypothetical protein
MGEEQVHVAGQLVLQERALLVDQQFGIAVVAHRDRHMHPRAPGDQVGAEHHAAVRLALPGRADDLGQHQAGRMAVAVVEAHRSPSACE